MTGRDVISRLKHAAVSVSQVYPPISLSTAIEVEDHLGFKLPETLLQIYTTIANGGFGPGYGLIGLKGGFASDHGDLVQTTEGVRSGFRYLKRELPESIVPFCEWGCSIYSAVDCSTGEVVRLEQSYDRLGYPIEEFFLRWLEGAQVFPEIKSSKKTRLVINPFTGHVVEQRGSE